MVGVEPCPGKQKCRGSSEAMKNTIRSRNLRGFKVQKTKDSVAFKGDVIPLVLLFCFFFFGAGFFFRLCGHPKDESVPKKQPFCFVKEGVFSVSLV